MCNFRQVCALVCDSFCCDVSCYALCSSIAGLLILLVLLFYLSTVCAQFLFLGLHSSWYGDREVPAVTEECRKTCRNPEKQEEEQKKAEREEEKDPFVSQTLVCSHSPDSWFVSIVSEAVRYMRAWSPYRPVLIIEQGKGFYGLFAIRLSLCENTFLSHFEPTQTPQEVEQGRTAFHNS